MVARKAAMTLHSAEAVLQGRPGHGGNWFKRTSSKPFEANRHAKICECRHDRGCLRAERSGRNVASGTKARSLKEPGTLQFEILLPKDDDTKVLTYEVYRDNAAFEVHRNGPSLAQWKKETAGMAKLHGVRCTVLD